VWAGGKPVKSTHRYTIQILLALKSLNLLPVEAEVPVLSYQGAFLTRSDLICRHVDTDDTVVVSLKTGGSLGYTKAQGACAGLPGLKNCVRTHPQMQLAMEVACIEREYDIPVSAAFVVYAGFGKKKQSKFDALLPIFRTPRYRAASFAALMADASKTHGALPHMSAAAAGTGDKP